MIETCRENPITTATIEDHLHVEKEPPPPADEAADRLAAPDAHAFAVDRDSRSGRPFSLARQMERAIETVRSRLDTLTSSGDDKDRYQRQKRALLTLYARLAEYIDSITTPDVLIATSSAISNLAGALERAGKILENSEDLRTAAKLNRKAGELRDSLIQFFAATDQTKWIQYLTFASGNYRGCGKCLAKAVALSPDDADKTAQYIEELRDAARQIEKAADTQNGLARRFSGQVEEWEDHLRSSAQDHESAGIRRTDAGKRSKAPADFLEAFRLKQKAADQFGRLAECFADSDRTKWAEYLRCRLNNLSFSADDLSAVERFEKSAAARIESSELRLELAEYYLSIDDRTLRETYCSMAALDLRLASENLAAAAERSGDPYLYERAITQREKAANILVELVIYLRMEVIKARVYSRQIRTDNSFVREYRAAVARLRSESHAG